MQSTRGDPARASVPVLSPGLGRPGSARVFSDLLVLMKWLRVSLSPGERSLSASTHARGLCLSSSGPLSGVA